FAQLPHTRLGTLFPPGGQAGTTFEVRVSGEQDLEYDAAPQLVFDHAGITAEPIMDAAGAWQGNAFRVTAAADVPPGRYEARIAGYYGASNPRTFRIEARPTVSEVTDATATATVALTADSAVYGRIETAADVDVFSFAGEEGKTVVVRCAAASLDAPLQPVVELAAPNGRRIGFAGGAFRGDVMLPIVLPASGEYRIKLTDASYRGGADFVYRLEVATRLVIASVFPPAGVPGQSGTFSLTGYNLPGGEPVAGSEPMVRKSVEITLPTDPTTQPRSPLLNPPQTVVAGFDYVFRDGGDADPVPVFFAPQPLVAETEPNDEATAAQKIATPAEIAGRFEVPNDVDRFVFDAKQGEALYVEAFARRYESSADPVIVIDQITAADGTPSEKQIAAADDIAENLAPNAFDTLTDDPLVRFEAPADGSYRVSVRDRYFASRGGPLLDYRLSIRKPAPDFQLAVVPLYRDKADAPPAPGALDVRKGESVAVGVYLFRRDGFSGPVTVNAEGLPAGVTTRGVTIAEGQTSASLVFTAAGDTAVAHAPIKVLGAAAIAGPDGAAQQVRHEARAGTLVRGGPSQAVESRLAAGLMLSVLEESIPFRVGGEGGVVRVGQGSQILLPLNTERHAGYAEPVTVAAEGLPADSKVTAEVKPFAVELPSQFARLVVDPTAPPRTYLVSLKGTAKIDVARFPLRLKKAKAAQEVATQALAQAEEALKQATAAREQATKTVEAVEAFSKTAVASLAAQAAAAVEATKAASTAIETTFKAAEEHRKQTEAAKQAADKIAAEAEKASAPQKIDYASPAPQVALTIVPAPATFAVAAPNGGQIKRGEAVEVKVTATRQNGFAGPIELTLALPPGVVGLTAEPVALPADQTEATLRISAAPEAAEGDVVFPAVRATSDHNGPVLIDVPIALKVVP
ncbi:MAG: hypothetical protein M3552_16630, partial [Planctomycetota bacterium]|nr:hypothetical protein [Planctomycetota bacterium]